MEKDRISKMSIGMTNKLWTYLTPEQTERFNKLYIELHKEGLKNNRIIKSAFVRELLLLGMEQWERERASKK